MTKMVYVTQEDANNYCRVLAALGLEDGGDPVAEIERLRVTLANESRRVCGAESDCVLQPHCSHAQKCMRPEWDAKA